MFLEPFLNGAGALMEDPSISISISVLDHDFEFASWIFDVKEAGGDELELIVVPA